MDVNWAWRVGSSSEMAFVKTDNAVSDWRRGYCGPVLGTSSRPKATGEPSWSENSRAILSGVNFHSRERRDY
jgi:hypothetical protein